MNRRILKLLMADGKMTYNEIAAKLRRSPSTVRDRIRRLEDDKVILGYYTIVNYEHMGLNADAIVLASLQEGKTVEDLRKMKQVPGVMEVLQVSGGRRVMIRLNASDNRSLEETIYQQLIPMGLCDVETRIVLDYVASLPVI
ncbi:MAG TPA: Lrp/AsnC family transcriptional regulator [Methanomassiliicoccales archaeon]|nr:Lrp/AsnC family transcriptional regulator [Methanomassiliicoccales archaeon]